MSGTILIATFLYIAPTMVAALRRTKNLKSVALGNMLMGWTGIGWLLALAYAFNSEQQNDGLLETPKTPALPVARDIPEYQRLLNSLDVISADILSVLKNRVINQIKGADDCFHAISDNLDRKLHSYELAHTRYLSTAQKTYECIMNYSSLSVSLLCTAQALVPTCIGTLEFLNPVDESQRQASNQGSVAERRQILHTQIRKVELLVEKSEQVLTSFSRLSARIAEMNIVNGRVPDQANIALEEIEKAIDRAKNYDSSPLSWGKYLPENKE